MPLQPPSHGVPDRGAALIEALANDTPTDAAYRALWCAARTWLATGGAVRLERCARLPSTPGAVRASARNLWIRQAAAQVAPGLPAHTQALQLADALVAFVERGPWQCWRDARTPPDAASELNKALFNVVKYSDGKILSARHISRVIANK